MQAIPRADNLWRGVGLVIFAEAVLVGVGILIRSLGAELPIAQMVFLRNAIGLCFVLPLVFGYRSVSLKTGCIHLHLARAALGVLAMSCLYYGWSHLPLGTAALLKQTGPLFMPMLALWFLGDRLTPTLRWSLPIGFIGVALVLQPSNASLQLAVLIGLLGAVLGASAKIAIRKMKDSEPSRRIVFYFALFSALFSAPLALAGWQWLTPVQWAGVAGIAGLSTLAQLSMTRAYQSAPPAYLGPFTYSSVIIATLVGWVLWDESLGPYTLLGMLLILVGGVLTVRGRA